MLRLQLCNVQEPNELEAMSGRNGCLGLLMILRDSFAKPRWELLGEAARLLDSCIEIVHLYLHTCMFHCQKIK
jgi:hypothetical protein